MIYDMQSNFPIQNDKEYHLFARHDYRGIEPSTLFQEFSNLSIAHWWEREKDHRIVPSAAKTPVFCVRDQHAC
jgi:hypothetical protein